MEGAVDDQATRIIMPLRSSGPACEHSAPRIVKCVEAIAALG